MPPSVGQRRVDDYLAVWAMAEHRPGGWVAEALAKRTQRTLLGSWNLNERWESVVATTRGTRPAAYLCPDRSHGPVD